MPQMFSFGVDVAQAATKVLPSPSNSVMDEETQKRNADCIYFLASPLTCKKGTSCEYRHSEAARVNPRDCWFWKAGNCLNPRCSYRHLPLDGKSVSAASIPSTSSTPVVPLLEPATVPSNKSKTPCYFFSQGYCSKNDKCPFMHGAPAASRADGATHKNRVAAVNDTVQSSGRPAIVLKQSALTTGTPVASNGSNVPITLQEMPQTSGCLEKPLRNGNFASLRHYEEKKVSHVQDGDAEQRKLNVQIKQGLNGANVSQGMHLQATKWRYPSRVDVLWEDCPSSGNDLDQSVLQSMSHQIVKSQSNSMPVKEQGSFEQIRAGDSEDLPEENWEPQLRCFRGQCKVISKHVEDDERAGKWKKQRMGPEEQDSSIDLCIHSMKEQKKNCLRAVSEKSEVRGHTHMVISGRGSQRLSKDRLVQQNEKPFASAVTQGTKAESFLQRASLSKVSSADKCPTLDNRKQASRNQTLNFTGPKSLAQIKAEKLSRKESALEAVGKQNLGSVITKSGDKLAATGKVAKPAEVTHIAVSSRNLSSSPMSTDSTIKSVYDEQKSVASREFESPKPLSLLLKRKRELETFDNGRETMPGPDKVESSMLGSCGEVGDDSEEYKEERFPSISCPSAFIKEDMQVLSQSSREEVQRHEIEAAEFNVDVSEELQSDIEMEDIAYGDSDYGICDDDDDDEDFAKKLGRFFALSSE